EYLATNQRVVGSNPAWRTISLGLEHEAAFREEKLLFCCLFSGCRTATARIRIDKKQRFINDLRGKCLITPFQIIPSPVNP
ncbi:hypothetical protein, partial [Sutterella sp.]|uniref:hypothetical protein n=1 Tax=Sutterella sp. TaxID=1981025 RepID=UPI0026E0D1AF